MYQDELWDDICTQLRIIRKLKKTWYSFITPATCGSNIVFLRIKWLSEAVLSDKHTSEFKYVVNEDCMHAKMNGFVKKKTNFNYVFG